MAKKSLKNVVGWKGKQNPQKGKFYKQLKPIGFPLMRITKGITNKPIKHYGKI